MLQFLLGAAILGLGIAIYINQYQNVPYSSDHGSRSRSRSENCTNTKSQPKEIKNYKVLICAICQESIGSLATTDLKCGHSFHASCLGDLIKNVHTRCPYCGDDIEIRTNKT